MDNDNHAGHFVNLCSIIVLSIGLTSCLPLFDTKPDVGSLSTIVEGRVTDFYTQNGIMGIPILIEDFDSEAEFWEMSYTYYDTIFTDSVGYYRYEFLNKVGRDYNVRPQSTDSYYDNQYWLSSIIEGKLNKYSFLYKPYRNLLIHFVNKQKRWSSIFFWNPISPHTIPQHANFDRLDIDSLFLMKFVPDQDIELNFCKSNGNAVQGSDIQSECFQLNVNFENKDTSIYIEY